MSEPGADAFQDQGPEQDQPLPAEAAVYAEPEAPAGVGTRLRAAREAAGVSVSEVSAALKFGVRQIEALEKDDFSSLTGATFVRGFVRSYARFLKLDEKPLLAMLEPHVPAQVVDMQPAEMVGAAMPVAGQRSYGKPLIAGLGVFVAVILTALGWQFMHGKPRAPNDSPVAVAPSGTEAPAPETATGKPGDPVAVPESAVLPGESAPAAPMSASPAPLATAIAVAPAPAVAVQAPTAAPATLEDGQRMLAFQFNDASWIEVRDARQRVILTGKFPANTQQAVRGKPPFSLVVGNAAAVKLRYEDRNVDLQPYIRAEVARLTLDDNN